MIGFGSAMLKKSFGNGFVPIKFDIFKDFSKTFLEIFVIFIALLSLVTTFVYGIKNNFKYDNRLAMILGGIYLGFAIVATVYESKAEYFWEIINYQFLKI